LRANVPILISTKLLLSLSITSEESSELMDDEDSIDESSEQLDIEELQGKLKRR